MAKRVYDRALVENDRAFDAPAPSASLRARCGEAGWPDGLLERVLAVRPDMGMLDDWLDTGFPTVDMIEDWATQETAQLQSSLNVRVATWQDNDMLSDLCQNAPETVGDWEVTVERGPGAYAQYRLQEHAYVMVAEDMRVGLAMASRSIRNTMIAGERTAVHFMSGWRVRTGFRGFGLAKMLMTAAGPGTSWFGPVSYWYVRPDNQDRSWITKVTDDMADRPEGWGASTNQLTASVQHLTEPSQGVVSARVRTATEDDLDRCLELINRTHDGLDLFRPYSTDYLRQRLDDPSWGPKPHFIEQTYGWADFLVLEAAGEIVACGGLWDRGRDVRERWHNPTTGEELTVAPTALLDVGFAAGHEADMAELCRHFLHTTAQLGRTAMMVAFEYLPGVRSELEGQEQQVETRELHVMPFVSPTLSVEANITQPYTDLAYW